MRRQLLDAQEQSERLARDLVSNLLSPYESALPSESALVLQVCSRPWSLPPRCGASLDKLAVLQRCCPPLPLSLSCHLCNPVCVLLPATHHSIILSLLCTTAPLCPQASAEASREEVQQRVEEALASVAALEEEKQRQAQRLEEV